MDLNALGLALLSAKIAAAIVKVETISIFLD